MNEVAKLPASDRRINEFALANTDEIIGRLSQICKITTNPLTKQQWFFLVTTAEPYKKPEKSGFFGILEIILQKLLTLTLRNSLYSIAVR